MHCLRNLTIPARLLALLGVCLYALLVTTPPAANPPSHNAAALTATASTNTPQIRTGIHRGRMVRYQLVDGQSIYQGDILLERVQSVTTVPGGAQTQGLGAAYPSTLWPKVGGVYQVPYTISSAGPEVTAAIAMFNNTFPVLIQWVPRTTQPDYVDFNLDPNDHSFVCRSFLGRIGGRQEINGSIDCAASLQLHEMGHAIGLYHEQSRDDRDPFIDILPQNIIKITEINFDPVPDNAQSFGIYDYASIMHYFPYAFSKNGHPTIESIPSGIPMGTGTAGGYTAGDIDGIKRLYNTPPTAVTITSNPSGLQVIVDGATVTTPQTFSWALNSTHTLNIPPGPQTRGGVSYTYGRWNDDLAASHSITVSPGNGQVSAPVTAPAVTVYTANFRQLVRYTQTTTGGGTVIATPPPQNYPPAAGQFYVARQTVTLQGTPDAGKNFYQFLNSPFFLPGPLGSNPKTFVVPDDGNPINVTGQFTGLPVTTITTNPPGLAIFVDGGFWFAPKNFARPFDPSWTVGSAHTVDVISPFFPYSSTVRYPWTNWSDGGARFHSINAAAANTTLTANFTPEYQVIQFLNQFCAGSINVTPASPTGDGFYPQGTMVNFMQAANPGWIFIGWGEDLSGTGNPQSLTANDELLVTTNHNTVSAPFTVTSLSPSSAVAGGSNFTLTVNGTGFSANTNAFINNVFRPVTFVSSTQITIAMTAADIATPGAFQVFVQSFPNGASCAVFSAKTFFVANKPLLTPTPASLFFAGQLLGTTSAPKNVTLRNNSTAPITFSSITASGNYTQTHTCPATLAVNATCVVTVRFSPTAPGTITGAITVIDSAVDAPHIIAITGTGATPLTFTPATLAFGSLAVGGVSAAKIVTLKNNQGVPLAFSFAASGNYQAVAGGVTPCGASLAANASCTVAVTFRPKVNGALNGALTVAHNAGFTPQIVSLSGTGIGGAAAPLAFTPSTLFFAATLTGTSSAAKTVTVTNSSGAAVTLSGITASGNYTVTGSGATPCGGILAAGASCALSVIFTPTLPGAIKGAIGIANGTALNPQVFNVSGTAVLPVSFTPASLNFAAQSLRSTSPTQTVTLRNNQTAALNIIGITASGAYSAIPGGANPCGASVPAKGSCTFTVNFTPNAIGAVKGVVTVTHGTGNSPQIVGLTGMGQ